MTPNQKKADAQLRSMKSKLTRWLKVRKHMDKYAAGLVPPATLRKPGTKPVPPQVVAASLKPERYEGEQDLANAVYNLLVETGVSPAAIPSPDVKKHPDAAVHVVEFALQGKAPSEVNGPQAQGVVWFVLAIPIAGIVFFLSHMVSKKAEVEMEKERLRCIEAGACTDSGFWLKIASMGVIGWFAWEKVGVGKKVQKLLK